MPRPNPVTGGRRAAILFLHSGGEWLRGSEYSLLSILGGLHNLGYRCDLWANSEELLQAASVLGARATFETFPYFMIDPGDMSIRPIATLRLALRIYRAIREQGYDLVYCNGALPAQAGRLAARLAGVPIICHVRAPYPLRYIHLFGINRCDCTVFVSNATRQQHEAKARFRNPVTIHNGIDAQQVADLILDADIPLPPQRFNSIRLCQVSAVIREKGVDTIIAAIELLAKQGIHPVFYIAGRGAELAHYRQLIEERQLHDQVFLIGEVRNVAKLFRHHVDVNVLAAAWEEPFGRVIVEGYLENKPAIGASTGGIPEIIRHEETGLLFETGNAQALADCIRRFHADRDSIGRMGETARQHADRNFSESVLLQRIDDAIRLTLGAKPGDRSPIGQA